MKTKFFSILILALLIIGASSCKKDKMEEEQMDMQETAARFACNLNGVAYESTGFEAYALPNNASNTTLVYGIQENGDNIYIQVPEILGLGEHLFSPQLFSFVSIGGKVYATHFVDEHSGKITITERTETSIQGTFEFVAYNLDNTADVLEVDTGVFDVLINQ